MSTGNIQQSPKKISKSSTTANISFCRLCKSVEDICCSKNIILSRTARCRNLTAVDQVNNISKNVLLMAGKDM